MIALPLLLFDKALAISALIGGAIGFIPALIYALKIGPVGNAPEVLLKAHYFAEFLKIMATMVLFAITFVLFKEINVMAMFLTYIATLAVYWLALFFA